MEPKKISFGFSKISKKPEITSKAPRKVELIDCLEGQSIKVRDAPLETKGPLVIPIQGSSNQIVERIKEKRIKKEEEEKPDSELTVDELAARELIREAKNRDLVKSETKVFTLPLTDDKFVANGAVEPSLDDYENVPISDYGMAMLRGMNWKEGMPIGRRTKTAELHKVPELRPKGLGLGANKLVSTKTTETVDKNGRKLQMVKGAFCKVIAGNHRGHFCEVQGLDDENCRVIVKTTLTHEILSLNEFLICLVTKEEFDKNSRVINNAKYDDYKESELKKERSRSRSREKKKKKKSKKSKYKSDSDSDERKRRHRKKDRRNSSSESDREYRRRRDKR